MLTKANELDAGWDLVAQHSGVVNFGEVTVFKTGVYGDVPPGTVGLVFARSGLSVRHGVRPVNAVAVIDSGFNGEILVALTSDVRVQYEVEAGDRIAQLVYIPLSAYVPGSTSDRGNGGFGSSGR